MLKVTGITQGIVIDHIKTGNGLKIFNKLRLDKLDTTVVLLMNVDSKALGRKDIIKIQDYTDINIDILGLIDQNATINIIKNSKIISKTKVEIPKSERFIPMQKSALCNNCG